MSIASNQSLLHGSRGKIGKLLTREVKGRTIISSLPDPDLPRTVAQNVNHAQFREASAFAKAAMLDPDVKAYFGQEAKRQKLPNPYTAAVSFKLTDIKTRVQNKLEKQEVSDLTKALPDNEPQKISDQTADNTIPNFKHTYHDILGPLEDALWTVRQVWRNFDRMNIDQTQKEVIQIALRNEIQRTLTVINLSSRAKSIEFKHPTPNFDHINALIEKSE